jgi:hypothetical protein
MILALEDSCANKYNARKMKFVVNVVITNKCFVQCIQIGSSHMKGQDSVLELCSRSS